MQFPKTSIELRAWALQQPWFAKLSACAQSHRWHQEGDVGIHTLMVLDEVLKLNRVESEKYILGLTAVFHDIAKPICSIVKDGDITSPGHSSKGASDFLRLTHKHLSPLIREQVYHLIRLHGKPPHAFSSDVDSNLALWSQNCNLDLLFTFCKCDMLGRICPDQQAQVDSLDLLMLRADELKCLTSPFIFPSIANHAPDLKIALNSQRVTTLNYTPHYPITHKVYMLMGLPGSGKDTYIAKNFPTLSVISFDDLRDASKANKTNINAIFAEAKQQAQELLAAKTSFVFNATNLTRSLRLKWLNLFYQYNATLVGIYIEPAYTKLLHQNSNRERPIPESALIDMFNILEYPSATDFHYLTKILDSASR